MTEVVGRRTRFLNGETISLSQEEWSRMVIEAALEKMGLSHQQPHVIFDRDIAIGAVTLAIGNTLRQ